MHRSKQVMCFFFNTNFKYHATSLNVQRSCAGWKVRLIRRWAVLLLWLYAWRDRLLWVYSQDQVEAARVLDHYSVNENRFLRSVVGWLVLAAYPAYALVLYAEWWQCTFKTLAKLAAAAAYTLLMRATANVSNLLVCGSHAMDLLCSYILAVRL